MSKLNAVKRAMLYVSRNKSRSIILLLIFFVVTILVLVSVSIISAANIAEEKIKENTLGYFRIEHDYTKATPEVSRFTYDRVQGWAAAGDIKGFSGADTYSLLAPDLELIAGKFTVMGDFKKSLARVISERETTYNEYFLRELFRLKEGRHIHAEDTNKALVSLPLAQQNGLRLGDTITLNTNTQNTIAKEVQSGTNLALEVVGFYEIVGYSHPIDAQNLAECELEENYIFTTRSIADEILQQAGVQNHFFGGTVVFVVNDPAQMDGIVDQIAAMEADASALKITKENQAYTDAAQPILRIRTYMATLLWITIGVSAVVLALVLAMWMRDRTHELGIYLSIGVAKQSIFLQNLLECLLVFTVGYAIGCVVSTFLSQQVLDVLLAGMGTVDTISTRIDGMQLLLTYALSGGMILLSLFFSWMSVIRMKPKDILSNIS